MSLFKKRDFDIFLLILSILIWSRKFGEIIDPDNYARSKRQEFAKIRLNS